MTGASLKAFRERINQTQTAMADLLGITRKTLAAYEKQPDREVPRVVALACRAIGDGLPPMT